MLEYEAQVGQGPITFHSQEHLAGSDKGVTMFHHVSANRSSPSPRVVTKSVSCSTKSAARYEIQAGNLVDTASPT